MSFLHIGVLQKEGLVLVPASTKLPFCNSGKNTMTCFYMTWLNY